VMRRTLVFLATIIVASCGGGGDSLSGDSATRNPTDPSETGKYTTSQPLVDNSGAIAFKVLLMGNSHAAGLAPVLDQLLVLGQPGSSVDVQLSPNFAFLVDRVNDGRSEEKLESQRWTHAIFQAQKYSSSGSNTYPTTAAEYWIRGSKEQGATPILFPEHPRKNNTWAGQTLWDLHTGIAARENTCVAPVGLVWDEVIFRRPSLILHEPDGNHASRAGLLLSALVFYQIITGQAVDSLPRLSGFNIDLATEQIMKDAVSSLLFLCSLSHPHSVFMACRYWPARSGYGPWYI
jgi:hypothetical protein